MKACAALGGSRHAGTVTALCGEGQAMRVAPTELPAGISQAFTIVMPMRK
jgi:hypothetical protein